MTSSLSETIVVSSHNNLTQLELKIAIVTPIVSRYKHLSLSQFYLSNTQAKKKTASKYYYDLKLEVSNLLANSSTKEGKESPSRMMRYRFQLGPAYF